MAASYTMATTKQKPLGDIIGARPDPAEVLMDEQLAATVTAYLDGRLPDGEREAFEGLLQNDAGLARAVQDMRAIEAQLVKLGSDILSEPVPDALLQAFSKLDGRSATPSGFPARRATQQRARADLGSWSGSSSPECGR